MTATPIPLPGLPPALSSPALGSYLRRHAVEGPDRLALVDGATGEQLTYAALLAQSTHVAAKLRESGVNHGDRVGIIATNSLPYVVLLLALADLGAIAVPQNTRLNPREITANLGDAQVSAIAAGAAQAETATAVANELGVSTRFLLDGETAGWDLLEREPGVDEKELSGIRPVAGTEPSGEDTAMLLYTSGTTGQAKGCMLAQRTWSGYALNMAMSIRMSRDDTYLAFLPYFHVAGLGLMLSQLLLGGTVVTQAAADPAEMHANIKRYSVTVVMVVPGVSHALVMHPDAAPAGESALRLVVSTAGLEQRAVIDAVTDRLGAEFVGIYGQTESGTKTTWAIGEEMLTSPGTYGRVMPSLTYRIVDADDNDVPDGHPGELLLRGSTVMQGYWNRPDATAETLRGGWHHTGDVFVHDGDGRLRMVDRTKYLIKTGGENVYPQEVENVLKQHPDVADVAVAGIPDPDWGETVKAFVVARAGIDLTRANLDAYVRQSVAGYKAPRFIEFVTEIPRNVSGKILKNELTARPTDPSQQVKGATA